MSGEVEKLEVENAEEVDRDQIILTCSMVTNYSEAYLEKLSVQKLMEIYDRVMEG